MSAAGVGVGYVAGCSMAQPCRHTVHLEGGALITSRHNSEIRKAGPSSRRSQAKFTRLSFILHIDEASVWVTLCRSSAAPPWARASPALRWPSRAREDTEGRIGSSLDDTRCATVCVLHCSRGRPSTLAPSGFRSRRRSASTLAPNCARRVWLRTPPPRHAPVLTSATRERRPRVEHPSRERPPR